MQDETIICIATRVWNSLWRDSQQLMSRIAARNRVLYFEPGRDPDRPHGAEMWRNCPNFFRLRAQAPHENLVVIPTPSCLPYLRRHLPRPVLHITTPWVAAINARILVRHVRRALQQFDVQRPILWLYEPRHIDLIGKFGEKLVCYFNYDELSEFANNGRVKDLIRDFDNRLSSRADVVFATSRGQAERRSKLNPHTYCTPNAVDFELFNQALDPATRIAPEVAGLRRPIIGFIGWLGNHIDVDLLLRVAGAYPSHSVVLVGPECLPDDARRRRLHAMPNVYFLGRKELSSLPAYLKAFDVALMPHLVSAQTLTAYPLKLHEYLAAGRPIAATALPELRPFSHVVRIAETHDAFIRQIDAALRDNAESQVEARVAVARANTWDQRVEMIYQVLREHPKMRDRNRAYEEHSHRVVAL